MLWGVGLEKGRVKKLTDDAVEFCPLVMEGLLGETGITSFAGAECPETERHTVMRQVGLM